MLIPYGSAHVPRQFEGRKNYEAQIRCANSLSRWQTEQRQSGSLLKVFRSAIGISRAKDIFLTHTPVDETNI
jgi:hypothetical protein